jgi:hypothetical protein
MSYTARMLAYIDESGDEGTLGRGSRWLTFGCICVRDSRKTELENLVRESMQSLKTPRFIHFVRLTHADKKGVLSIWRRSRIRFRAIIVASDTTKVDANSWLSRTDYQYNYALRYALERVSKLAKEWREPAQVIIEQRRNFNLPEFRKYLRTLRNRRDDHFEWNFLSPNDIRVAKKEVELPLAMADGFAHAAFKALESERGWSHTEPGYLEVCTRKLWRGPVDSEDIQEYGFVLMPTAEQSAYRLEYPWLLSLQDKDAPLR